MHQRQESAVPVGECDVTMVPPHIGHPLPSCSCLHPQNEYIQPGNTNHPLLPTFCWYLQVCIGILLMPHLYNFPFLVFPLRASTETVICMDLQVCCPMVVHSPIDHTCTQLSEFRITYLKVNPSCNLSVCACRFSFICQIGAIQHRPVVRCLC